MDIGDIKTIHETEEGIINNPYLPREKAISMLQQAHSHRGLLLAEVERLQRVIELLLAANHISPEIVEQAGEIAEW